MPRFPKNLTPFKTERERQAFQFGIVCAAEFAGTWDKQIAWPYRFADVILHKFNLRKPKPRKKRW